MIIYETKIILFDNDQIKKYHLTGNIRGKTAEPVCDLILGPRARDA